MILAVANLRKNNVLIRLSAAARFSFVMVILSLLFSHRHMGQPWLGMTVTEARTSPVNDKHLILAVSAPIHDRKHSSMH